MHRLFLAFIIPTLFLVSESVYAVVLPEGCRVPTAADKAKLSARGLPIAGMVCQKDIQALKLVEFDRWFDTLKRTRPCNQSKSTLSYKTKNTGAQVCGTISRKWGAIGCHPNNNTAIFPTVEKGFAAHVDLTKRFCTKYGRCTITSLVDRWTAIPGDRPGYVRSLSNWTGIPSRQRFDPNDCELIGRIALASSCFEAGSLPYSKNQIKRGLAMACGGKIPPASQFQPNPLLDSVSRDVSSSVSNYVQQQPYTQPQPRYSPYARAAQTRPPQQSIRPLNSFTRQGGPQDSAVERGVVQTAVGTEITLEQAPIEQAVLTQGDEQGTAVSRRALRRRGKVVMLLVPNNDTVRAGERVTLKWASLNADMCRVVGPGVRKEARYGRARTPIISERYLRGKSSLTYTMLCINKSGVLKKTLRIPVGSAGTVSI